MDIAWLSVNMVVACNQFSGHKNNQPIIPTKEQNNAKPVEADGRKTIIVASTIAFCYNKSIIDFCFNRVVAS